MSARGSYYPWTVFRLAVEEHHDLLSFLAAAQRCEVDMLPITWQHDRNFIGSGGTADLSQTRVDMYTSLAFKRMRPSEGNETLKRENFKALTSELLVYKYPPIIEHPNILQLEGFCWEVGSDDSELLPVLVFAEAELGDLQKFMQTKAGRKTSFKEKMQWCLAILDALEVLHDNGSFTQLSSNC